MRNFTNLNMKITIACLIVALSSNLSSAQNPFKFKKVDFIGAMSSTDDWTKDWANWNPEQTNYPAANETVTLNAGVQSSGIINLTSDVTLDASKVYLLTGLVYVNNGVTLNIPAGTIIRCEANTTATPANWATLVVQRGGKVNFAGTQAKPIVFTSNKAAGNRNPGDWGGIILLGKASNNLPGGQSSCTQCVKGEGIVEGPFGYPEGAYGGNQDNDNSGTMTYVRLEFPGLVYAANNEVNGLTLGSVGYNTTLHHLQVSFSNDDSYEWYGGTVNSTHLIAFRGVDDDFDTDFGYNGNCQFGIGYKDSIHFDATYNASSGSSTSEGFESDNDGSGSTNTPLTAATYSNFTMIGPYLEGSSYNDYSTTVKSAYRRGARIRRNSATSIFNSIFMGYRNGIMIDGSASEGNANITSGPTNSDLLMVRNNILLGMTFPGSSTANSIIEVANGRDTAAVFSWFKKSNNKINPVAWSKGTLLVNASLITNPDLRPITNSVANNGADFTTPRTPFTAGIKSFATTGSVNVYPNPSQGNTNVELNLVNNTTLNITLSGIDGKLVKSINNTYPAGKSVVNLDNLKAGVYFGMISNNESFTIFKLIVE